MAALLWFVPAAVAQVSFSGPTSFPVGNQPRSVAIGDFDGDADFDLASANAGSDDVSVLLGAGDGSFTAGPGPAAGDLPFSVAVGEFNDDGDPDLAVANRDSENVSVLLGATGPGFSGPNHFSAGGRATWVAVGEFNADGDPDLAVVNNADGDVSVFLGGAGGSFGQRTDFAVGATPRSVAVGDFDGDLDQDLAVTNDLDSDVSVLLGEGDGTFTSGDRFATGLGPVSVAVGRFDPGEDLDVVTANQRNQSVSVLLGSTEAGFEPSASFPAGQAPASVAVADLDGDTHLDLVVANELPSTVSVLRGAGDGTFAAPATFATGSLPFSIAVGELNGDGRSDLAIADRNSNNVSVLLNTTNRAPVAVDDTYETNEDAALDVDAPGVLGNDGNLDGDDLSVSLVSGPEHGTLTLNDDGSFTYHPEADYNGPDAFTYTVSDGSFDSNTATVELIVTAVNDLPSAGDDAYTTDEDASLSVGAPGVLGNDDDPEGEALSASFVSGPGHGTLTLSADGSFTYTPDADYNGPDAFTYHASDGGLNSTTATVVLTVSAVNDTPSAGDDAYTTDENAPLSVGAPGVLDNDGDPEGDALTASLVSGPGHGTLTLNDDGSFTYTPEPGYNGLDAFTYTVSDGSFDSNTATVALNVTAGNDARTPPPGPSLTPAPGLSPPPSAAPAPDVSLRVGVARRSVFAPRATAGCAMSSGRIDSCRVALRVGGRLVARGERASTRAERRLRVALNLTAYGQRLLTTHLGGIRARIAASGVAAGRTDTATSRTRAMLKIERFTTPPGSWVPDRAVLTPAGRRFVHHLRGRVIAVAGARCDGHVAGDGPGTGLAVSLQRARVICHRLRQLGMTGTPRLVAHGNRDPIATNRTEPGRARNRRVEVTLRHRPGPLIFGD